MESFKFRLGDMVEIIVPTPNRPLRKGRIVALTITEKTTMASVLWMDDKNRERRTCEHESNLRLR
jgi:hypothetical protein